jgi:hypothetical protein
VWPKFGLILAQILTQYCDSQDHHVQQELSQAFRQADLNTFVSYDSKLFIALTRGANTVKQNYGCNLSVKFLQYLLLWSVI